MIRLSKRELPHVNYHLCLVKKHRHSCWNPQIQDITSLGEVGRTDSVGKNNIKTFRAQLCVCVCVFHTYRSIGREIYHSTYVCLNCPKVKIIESWNKTQRGINNPVSNTYSYCNNSAVCKSRHYHFLQNVFLSKNK